MVTSSTKRIVFHSQKSHSSAELQSAVMQCMRIAGNAFGVNELTNAWAGKREVLPAGRPNFHRHRSRVKTYATSKPELVGTVMRMYLQYYHVGSYPSSPAVSHAPSHRQ